MGRPRRVDDDDDDDLPPPPGSVEPRPAWDCRPIAKQVQAVLDAVEAPPIDRETRLTLQRYLYRRNRYGAMFKDDDDFGPDGRAYITLLCRTILESEGNQNALIEPVVVAVGSCMRAAWIRKGIEFIAAFDRIPLVDILNKLRELDLFPENELQHHYAIGIERRLWRIFGPDVVPELPKPKAPSPPRSSKRIRARRPLKKPARRMTGLTRKRESLEETISYDRP